MPIINYLFSIWLLSLEKRYFYLSYKRSPSPTIILFGKIFQALVIKDPSFIYFFFKSLKNWVNIEKKFLYVALQKFQALR